MSDIHILEVGSKPDNARVAFHYDTPGGNNFAGVAWATALIQYLESRFSPIVSGQTRQISIVPDLETDDPTEYAALEDGSKYEIATNIQFDANLTNAQKWAIIQAAYTAQEAEYQAEMSERLDFWGQSGSGS